MEADELLEFLETRMRMSHVYQPLLIRCLLDAGGQATLQQLAIEFAKEDRAGLTTLTTCRCCVPAAIVARATVTARTFVTRVASQIKSLNDGPEHPW